jgi:hypothetical protein
VTGICENGTSLAEVMDRPKEVIQMLKQMKQKSFAFVAAALLTVGGAGVAFAHGRGEGGGEGGKGGPPSAEEQKAHEARRAEMLAKYDTNKDGKLDDTERAAMRTDMVNERFTQLDTNKDGVLSKAEFAAGAPMMGPHGHHGPDGDHDRDEAKKPATK